MDVNRGTRAISAVMRAPEFWRSLLPRAPDANYAERSFTPDTLKAVRSSLRERGYFQLDSVFHADELARVRAAVDAVQGAGLPPLFVFAYEDPWLLYASLSALLRSVLGSEYRSLAAFWAWQLDPLKADAGWPRHRDRTFRTVNDDGHPDVVTIWLAITDATPDNGCIRVVPRDRDPEYDGHLARLSFRASDARELSAPAGSVLGWTHQLIHWGGRASRAASAPRISLSAEFQSRSKSPYDAQLDRIPPPLEERLALMATQLLKYRHMQSPSPALFDLARSLARATNSR